MEADNIPARSNAEEKSYGEILKDIGSSAKEIVINDAQLILGELKQFKKATASRILLLGIGQL